MKKQLLISIKIFVVFTVLLGIFYPLFITAVAQLAFPEKANGSLIIQDKKVIGSQLIGQKFDSAAYFSSRPSATDYSALPSGASNLGPSSSKLKQEVAERKARWQELNPQVATKEIPSEMLFASASGLDPDISPASAFLQVDRIVKARQFDESRKQQLIAIIEKLSEGPQFFILGESRVNVLMLNLELDKLGGQNTLIRQSD